VQRAVEQRLRPDVVLLDIMLTTLDDEEYVVRARYGWHTPESSRSIPPRPHPGRDLYARARGLR
jgi:hypothetical protein